MAKSQVWKGRTDAEDRWSHEGRPEGRTRNDKTVQSRSPTSTRAREQLKPNPTRRSRLRGRSPVCTTHQFGLRKQIHWSSSGHGYDIQHSVARSCHIRSLTIRSLTAHSGIHRCQCVSSAILLQSRCVLCSNELL